MVTTQVQTPTPKLSVDAFIADRQGFWNFFTKLVFNVSVFLVVLLIGMAIFLA